MWTRNISPPSVQQNHDKSTLANQKPRWRFRVLLITILHRQKRAGKTNIFITRHEKFHPQTELAEVRCIYVLQHERVFILAEFFVEFGKILWFDQQKIARDLFLAHSNTVKVITICIKNLHPSVSSTIIHLVG